MQQLIRRVAVAAVFALILGASIAVNAQTQTTSPNLQMTPTPSASPSASPT